MKFDNNKIKTIIKCILIIVVYGIIYLSLGSIFKKIPFLQENEFLRFLINYIILSIVLITYLYYTNQLNILKFDLSKLFTGFKIGIVFIIISCIMLVTTFSTCISEGYKLLPIIKIIIFILAILIGTGFTEEVLFRGIVLNNLFKAFGRKSKKNVVISIIISSILFGLVHITNGFTDSDFSTSFYQALQVIGMGLVYGAIYARCKSIYSVMLIHGFWDICGSVKSGFFGIQTMLVAVDTSQGKGIIVVLFFYIIYIPIFLFLMRKRKMNEYLEDDKNL